MIPSQEWIGSCSPLLTEVDTNKILLIKFREEGKKLRRSSVVEKPEHSSRPAAQLEEPRRCWQGQGGMEVVWGGMEVVWGGAKEPGSK